MKLRMAGLADTRAILDVYAQYIDTPITFETDLPGKNAFRERIRSVRKIYPWIVAEENGRLAGYAYAHCPWERAAYRWNAELSVYLDRDFRGYGLGTRLYRVMIELLRLQNVRVALACVTVPNAASERMHAALGFTQSAFFARAGWKNGAWHDVAWLSLPLCDDEAEPLPLTPADCLDPGRVRTLLGY